MSSYSVEHNSVRSIGRCCAKMHLALSCVCLIKTLPMSLCPARLQWFGRMGHSLCGAAVGLLLFVVAFPLLIRNEGAAVVSYASLTEGLQLCVPIDAAAPPDPANNGRLVHVSGLVHHGGDLVDREFGVVVDGIALRREVEVFQYTERKHTRTSKDAIGGGETRETFYTYDRVWSSSHIDSSRFHDPSYRNPPHLGVHTETLRLADVRVGRFQLSQSALRQVHPATEVDVGDPAHGALAALAFEHQATGAGPNDARHRKALALANSMGQTGRAAVVAGKQLYIGTGTALRPLVGDVRVSFTQAKPDVVSVIARQADDELLPFQTRAGDVLELVQPRHATALEMFAAAQHDASMRTWMFRGVGWFLMVLGLLLLLQPAAVALDVVPVVGWLLSGLVQGGALLAALTTASVCAMVTIGVSWLFFRPVVSVALFFAAGAAAAVARGHCDRRSANDDEQDNALRNTLRNNRTKID